MLTPDLDENTEKLSNRARALINAEFRSLLGSNVKRQVNQQTHLRVFSPQTQSATKLSSKNDVRTARKRIQEEWDALKNATMISNESPGSSDVLVGVVAYIEINNVPKSIALKVILENLGATVKDKFTPEVTHVIFKRGTFETFKRAKLLNAHLVSVLWIEACKSSKKRVAEELFPVADHKDYASPRTFRRIMERGSKAREQLVNQAIILNTKQKENKQTNEKRVTRSAGKSPGDSSESVLVLQISTDDSGKKNNEKNKNTDIDKPQQKRRLFASAGDEEIDHDATKKKKLDAKFKRKLFTPHFDDSTLTEHSSDNSVTVNLKDLNPYQIPGKQRVARTKKNMPKQKEQQVRNQNENLESSQSSESDETIDTMEQVRELIKLTQGETAKKPAKERKRRLIKEKKKKLTKEEKENLKKANKMARRQENQSIKASQPRSCKKINIYSKGIKNPSLVSTFLHKPENKWLRESIDRLGGFTFKATVERDTTHVVAGRPVRTINLLKGLARGCWLVDKRWVQDSLAAGHWLTEYEYELTEFSTAVQKCRLERQVLGHDYRMDIFSGCGGVYVGSQVNAKRKDLRALLSLCGGKQVSEASFADLVVGENASGKTCVKEQWILDSITAGRCKSLKKYAVL